MNLRPCFLQLSSARHAGTPRNHDSKGTDRELTGNSLTDSSQGLSVIAYQELDTDI